MAFRHQPGMKAIEWSFRGSAVLPSVKPTQASPDFFPMLNESRFTYASRTVRSHGDNTFVLFYFSVGESQ